MELISQGSEAKIYQHGDIIIKHRFSKSYRIKEIDTLLTKRRTRAEMRTMQRLLEKGINVPKLLKFQKIDPFLPENTIFMEKITGIPLQEQILLNESILFDFGKLIRTIHDCNIVHGDITTANFIVNEDKIFAIDFGLSFHSVKDEDKAVDLYVFEKSLKCAHNESILKYFYDGYGESPVLIKLEAARKRARKLEENALG